MLNGERERRGEKAQEKVQKMYKRAAVPEEEPAGLFLYAASVYDWKSIRSYNHCFA